MTEQDAQKLSETFYRDPNWIAANGGWLHSNNVLFYFGTSPFCDPTSKNVSLFIQSCNIPELIDRNLRDKHTFERRLQERPGIEYVVAHDPLEGKVSVQGPTELEQSRIWVIRKQNREKVSGEGHVTPLAFYYILTDTIFQAPSAGDILTNRLLTTVTSLTNMLSASHEIDVFSPARGHSYSPPQQKNRTSVHTGLSQRSKESTPMPGSQSQTASNMASTEPSAATAGDLQTLVEAIRMTMQYGNEYVDEVPLVGEPGNFRWTTKHRDTLAPSAASTQTVPPTSSSRDNSQPPPRKPSPPPPLQTNVPPVTSKKSARIAEGSPDTPGGPPKPKRRKSKVASAVD